MPKYFTNHEVEYILANAGKIPLKEMCDHLGRTERSITGYCIRHGISVSYKYKKHDPAKKGEALKMLSEGVSPPEISVKTGLPPHMVHALKRLIAG